MSQFRRIAVALRIDEPYPRHQEVLLGVRQYAHEHPSWQCVVDEHPGYTHQARHRVATPYDGVIARADLQLQRRLRQLGIPYVNTWYQHARPGTAGVYSDVIATGRLAAEHLLQRGFRRFAFVGVPGFRQAREIGEGFASCVADRGCACRMEECQLGDFGDRNYWFSLQAYLECLLDGLTPPVGVFVIVPWVARLLNTICEDRTWRVAHDLAVVCWDNLRSIVELRPQITCIDSNFVRVGYEAAKLLDQLMAGQPISQEPVFVPPKGIIARESTDYFAVEDETVAAALRYISQHLGQPLSVAGIAEAIAVSQRTLQRQFEAALGRPVSDEIRRLRLELTKRLLGEEGLQVSHIARVAGFKSAVTLNHVFQRELGLSPSAYRKQVIGERMSHSS